MPIHLSQEDWKCLDISLFVEHVEPGDMSWNMIWNWIPFSWELRSKGAVHPQSPAWLKRTSSHLSTRISSDITSHSGVCYDHLFPANSPDRQCALACSGMKFKMTPHWPLPILRLLGHTPRLPMKGTSTLEHFACEPQGQLENQHVKAKDNFPWP